MDEFMPGPNTANIREAATRIIVGQVPARVRAELSAAVKAGYLGHLRKDGLLPEIYFHPDHKNDAIEMRKRHAEYSIRRIANILA